MKIGRNPKGKKDRLPTIQNFRGELLNFGGVVVPQPNPNFPTPTTHQIYRIHPSYVMFTQSWEKLPASSGAAQVKGSQVLIGWKHRKATVGDDFLFFISTSLACSKRNHNKKSTHLPLFAEHQKNKSILYNC